MTCDRCVWGRWVKGKRTHYWFRVCKRCGTGERSAVDPEPTEDSKPLAFDVPQVAAQVMDLKAGYQRPMQKVSVQARKAGQQFRADWKEKQSGGES